MIGKKISHYSVTEKLGAGGMGEVYRATDTKLNRDVALKVLPEEFARDADRMARFKREAQVLASLNHPNIASIYGLEESDGIRCLVLELVEGPTLAERIAAGPLPAEEALNIARQIAEALEAAHEKGIIHRDLKPANVKVTPEGTVKVLDFGLAKALEGESAEQDVANSPTLSVAATQAGVILGTAAYMSPEQARGQAVDKRADIWAFGVVLYEMLTGKQTFQGETISDVLAHVLTKEPEWDALPADVPPPIRKLLRRCLTRERKQRLQAIGEARIAIEEYAADPAASVMMSGAALAGPQPAWRRALPWVLLGAMTLIAALALLTLWRGGETKRGLIRLSANVSGEEPLRTSQGAAAVLSPDGKRLAYTAGAGTDRMLYLRSLHQLEGEPLSGTEGAFAPFFSPDGQWVAFFAANSLKKVSVQGGAPLTLCETQDSRGGTWSDDGTIVFAPATTTGLSRVPAGGGTPEALTEIDSEKNERSHRWPFFLPGGKHVLFIAQEGGVDYQDANIEVVSLETGERKVVHQGGTYARYLPTGHLVYLRDATLFAAPFDLGGLEVSGLPAPVLEGVMQTGNGGGQYSFSETGTLLYLAGSEALAESTMVWVDRKGSVKPLIERKRGYEDLHLSPDSRQVAVEVNMPGAEDIIWLYDIERGTMTRLTFGSGGSFQPVWTPDGKRVVFASTRESAVPGLYWKRADGAGEAERLVPNDRVQLPSSWSPDGKVLAYTEAGGTTLEDIMILRLGEQNQREVFLQTPFVEDGAQFSPDGRWVAYHSNESGTLEVYVRPFPGPGGKWQISTEGGFDPRWSSSGSELFYRSGGKVMAVSVSARGESFRAGTLRQLFEGNFVDPSAGSQAWDVTPDGKRFVMLQSESGVAAAQTHLNFIFNWFEEVRRLVPAGKD